MYKIYKMTNNVQSLFVITESGAILNNNCMQCMTKYMIIDWEL